MRRKQYRRINLPPRLISRLWLAAVFAHLVFIAAPELLDAQPLPSVVLAPGNAAVTGFSGVLPPIQIAPGVGSQSRHLHQFGRRLAAHRRFATHEWTGARTARRCNQAVHIQCRIAGSGIWRHARQCFATEYLRRREFGLRPADLSRRDPTAYRNTSKSAPRTLHSCRACGARMPDRVRSGRLTA